MENKRLLETNMHLNNPLTIEASLERQDPTGAPNGDVQEEKFTCTKISLIEHERILGEKNSEIMRLTSELSTQETEATARVEEKDNEIGALTCKLNNNIKEVEELKKEIKVWHAKNDDLRKKNWKAMEAVAESEKSTEQQIVDAVCTAEMQAADTFSHDRALLQSIFPSITVDKSLKHTIWMKTFEQKAVEFLKSKADEPVSDLKEMTKNVELFEKKLDVAMKESTELAAQLKTEKDLQIKISDKLKESETKFIELQSTYEIKSLELSNELAIQTKKYSDLKKMYEALHSNLQHNEVENKELKEHVNSLNMRLAEAPEDKIKLENKLKEYQNLFLITDEKLQLLQKSVEEEEEKWKHALAEAEKEIQILKEKQTSLEYLKSEVSKQQALIEEEQRKNRDLAQTVVKLNGIIKTGQDALSQEQKLVENLKQKLSVRESSNSTQKIEQVSLFTICLVLAYLYCAKKQIIINFFPLFLAK
uniref:Uncharacterized protein n=1 Tax=Octopus bimaculoides TaxID=37653 RepID=A0A0L8FG96_OCTBM